MNTNMNAMTAWVDTRTEELMNKFHIPYAEAHEAAVAEWNAAHTPAPADAPAEPKAPRKRGGKKPTGKKAEPKADKPATRREALAKWEADKGITPESKARYKELVNSNSEFYKALWAKREGDKAYEADKKKHGKSVANKNWHKRICALAAEEAKK